MDELVVRGLVLGVVFALVGGAAALIWKLFRSPSEGARRIRWVLYGLAALFVGACVLAASGPGGLLVAAAIIGASIWVFRGFKR